jgi:uncharacterized integral membrane protein
MSLKTIIIIILSVLVTIVFMQNTDEVLFKFLWNDIYLSKMIMMIAILLIGFVAGMIVARPRKKSNSVNYSETQKNVPLEINNPESSDYQQPNQKNTLSDEDREYLN